MRRRATDLIDVSNKGALDLGPLVKSSALCGTCRHTLRAHGDDLTEDCPFSQNGDTFNLQAKDDPHSPEYKGKDNR